MIILSTYGLFLFEEIDEGVEERALLKSLADKAAEFFFALTDLLDRLISFCATALGFFACVKFSAGDFLEQKDG